MKARAILNSLYQDANSIEKFDPIIANNSVDTALLALKEMVLQLRRKSTTSRIHSYDKGFNSAIESVAKLFEDSK